MSKEVEKSNLKVMKLENKLKQKQKKLEEVQSEMLKYTSKIGKIIEDQSFLEENNQLTSFTETFSYHA